MSAADLVVAFAEARGDAEAPAPDLARKLEELWERGRRAFPEVHLEPTAFARHVATCIPRENAIAEALRHVHGEGLYLACACLAQDPAAHQAFADRYLSRIPAYVGRMNLSPALQDEVRQQLAEKLLVSHEDKPPKLTEYGGRGELESWVRICAIRTALSLLRRDQRRRQVPWDEAPPPEDALGPVADPELEIIKNRYREEFGQAFREALRLLAPRDRNLLRLHYLDRLGIGEIGTVHGVHRTTVARWLASAQQAAFVETRRLLRERLQISSGEFESLMGLVRSRLDVTLHSLMTRSDD